VSIDPKLETPKGQEKSHKLMQLMEEYTAELKRDDYLSKYKQVNHAVQLALKNGSEFVGSFACRNCHAAAYKIWENLDNNGNRHGHSRAYETLVKAEHPSNRQFDGECIVCHTVGFGYKTGFESLAKTSFLTDVGCESCHGPCGAHVEKPRDAAIYKEINPFKWRGPGKAGPAQENARMLHIGDFCQKCHDQDNDNNFQFNLKWPKIVHLTPPANQPAANGPPKK
jgi:Cytochrome c554 and c-prime